jgi:hypothetical protein
VAEVRALDFKSSSFGEMDVVFTDKAAALVTVEGTENGKDISGKKNAASIRKKRGAIGASSFTLT